MFFPDARVSAGRMFIAHGEKMVHKYSLVGKIKTSNERENLPAREPLFINKKISGGHCVETVCQYVKRCAWAVLSATRFLFALDTIFCKVYYKIIKYMGVRE